MHICTLTHMFNVATSEASSFFSDFGAQWPHTDGQMTLTSYLLICKHSAMCASHDTLIRKHTSENILHEMGSSTVSELRHVDLNQSVLSPGLLAKGSSAVAGRLCEQRTTNISPQAIPRCLIQETL